MLKYPTCNQKSNRGRVVKANCILLKKKTSYGVGYWRERLSYLKRGKLQEVGRQGKEVPYFWSKKDNVDRKNTKNEFKGE